MIIPDTTKRLQDFKPTETELALTPEELQWLMQASEDAMEYIFKLASTNLSTRLLISNVVSLVFAIYTMGYRGAVASRQVNDLESMYNADA